MDFAADELAGIADLFGALPRESLERATTEVAFKEGEDLKAGEIEEQIDDALRAYALVSVDLDGETLLAPGPTAFPELPSGATDLPHILDEPRREVPREAIETSVRRRLAGAAAAIDDPGRAAELIDITYDAEAWAGLDLTDVRERLEAIREDPG